MVQEGDGGWSFVDIVFAGARRESVHGTALYQSETRTPSLPPPDSESGTVQFEAGTEQSESGTVQSEAGTEQSESGTEQSESGTEQSESGTVQSESGTEQSESGTVQSESGTVQSESGTVQSAIWYRAFQSCCARMRLHDCVIVCSVRASAAGLLSIRYMPGQGVSLCAARHCTSQSQRTHSSQRSLPDTQ